MSQLIPQAFPMNTPLDDLGNFLDLPRLLNESLVSYKARLLSVYAQRANSTYQGVVNGLTRELGLTQSKGIRINLKSLFTGTIPSGHITLTTSTLTDTSQAFPVPNGLVGFGLQLGDETYQIIQNTATIIQIGTGNLTKFITQGGTYNVVVYNPKIDCDGPNLTLYRDYFSSTNYKLDTSINLRTENTFLDNVIDSINGSSYFSATALYPSGQKIRAYLLEKQDSITPVLSETVPPAKVFTFKNTGLIQGSVFFSETYTFQTEVPISQVPNAIGNYNIDYGNGTVIVNGQPSGVGTVAYDYYSFPYDLIYSPVVMTNFKSPSAETFLFLQVPQVLYTTPQSQYAPGQPTPDMIEYIAELLSVSPLYWGT